MKSEVYDDPAVLAADWQVKATRPSLAWLDGRAGGWQFGEAGFLQAICERLGVRDGVEIGAGDGTTLPLTLDFLYQAGAEVVLYEADENRRKSLLSKYPSAYVGGHFDPRDMFVTEATGIAVVDVDSIDLKIACRVAKGNPAVICVEHYDLCAPDSDKHGIPPDWLLGKQLADGGFMIQATAADIQAELDKLGYDRIGMSRVNSIFVRSDLVPTLEGC